MTRQVALSEHAYARLRRYRLRGESFSQVVERLLDKQEKDAMAALENLRKLPRIMTPEEHLAWVEADRNSDWMEF